MHPYDTIARYYDLEHADYLEDVEFYRNMLADGPVLEVGVGTARIMRRLVEEGLEVWGVDSSQAMLTRARDKMRGSSLGHLVHGTLADLPSDVVFAAVIFPLNALWHFDSLESQLAVLVAAQQRLRPGGLLLIDCSNPLSLADRDGRGEVRCRFRKNTGDINVSAYSSVWDDGAEQILDLSLTYEESSPDGQLRSFPVELKLRYVYRTELQLLLQISGFEVRHIYGDYDLTAYDSESPRLLVTAGRP